MIKIAEKKNKAYVRDFVPEVFKHYSSFYKILKSMNQFIVSEKDIENRTFYKINISKCFITANLLKEL